jgi:hypothetical protein
MKGGRIMYNVVISFRNKLDETRILAGCLTQGARIEPCPGTDRFKILGLTKTDAEELYEVAQYFNYF